MTMMAPRTIFLGKFCTLKVRMRRPHKCLPRSVLSKTRNLPRPPAMTTKTIGRSNEVVSDHRACDSLSRARFFPEGPIRCIGRGSDADPRGTLRTGIDQVGGSASRFAAQCHD